MNQTDPHDRLTADVVLAVEGHRLQMRVSVDAGPTPVRDLIPVARAVAGAVVDIAVARSAEEGQAISCKKGCGACCRQMVPVGESEARQIRHRVESLPEPRRAEVRRRFEDAWRRLDDAGLFEVLQSRESWTPEDVERRGLEYFRLGIPCPFLEEESCSIHAERPLSCREYLVTSPAECCAAPTRENIDTLRIPLSVWPALALCDRPATGPFIPWVPLVLAPRWADDCPPPAARPGPEVVKQLFENLTGRPVPGAPQVPFRPAT